MLYKDGYTFSPFLFFGNILPRLLTSCVLEYMLSRLLTSSLKLTFYQVSLDIQINLDVSSVLQELFSVPN